MDGVLLGICRLLKALVSKANSMFNCQGTVDCIMMVVFYGVWAILAALFVAVIIYEFRQ